jgi:hypothetical protein
MCHERKQNQENNSASLTNLKPFTKPEWRRRQEENPTKITIGDIVQRGYIVTDTAASYTQPKPGEAAAVQGTGIFPESDMKPKPVPKRIPS